MARWRKILSGNDGSEIAEAALVLPIAFMILLAIYWFGLAFNIYGTINHAAREGARIAVAQTCASCGNTPPTTATIASGVTNALLADHLRPSQIIAITPAYASCAGAAATCASSSNVYVCTNVQLVAVPPAASGAPACGVTIDFQYPYQAVLPFTSISNQALKLSAHVQMRSEQ